MSDSPLHTPLCALLGCRYPILQAGMGGVARSELAAAVSAAGGFGCLGMVRESPEMIRREIAGVRDRTDRPFAVNLIPAATDKALFREELTACLEAQVGALVFFWDVEAEAIATVKAAGARVLYQVGSVADAQAAETAGADAVIVQGIEAGGHVRGGVSSLVLLPQVARAVAVPVVGSGGFASGTGLAAALALGAQGVHCGTAFLATEESFAHDLHKRRVVEAGSGDTVHTDAYAINWPPDAPVRVLRSRQTDALGNRLFGHHPDRLPREQVADEEGRPIYLMSTDSPLRSMTGDLERLALFAGQAAGMVERVEPAAAVVERITGSTAAKRSASLTWIVRPIAAASAALDGLPRFAPCRFLTASAALVRSAMSRRFFSAEPPTPSRPEAPVRRQKIWDAGSHDGQEGLALVG